jgi:hypothetical protein
MCFGCLIGRWCPARLIPLPVSLVLNQICSVAVWTLDLSTRVRNASAGFPGARRLVASLFTLPTHGLLSERDLRALERWVAGGD